MKVGVVCPSGHAIKVPREYLGKRAKCPKCRVAFELVEAKQPLPPPAELVDENARGLPEYSSNTSAVQGEREAALSAPKSRTKSSREKSKLDLSSLRPNEVGMFYLLRFFGPLLLLMGIVSGALVPAKLMRAKAQKSWPTTPAQVASARIEQVTNFAGSGRIRVAQPWQKVMVDTVYIVEGERFSQAFEIGRFKTLSQAENRKQNAPTEIMIAYDPNEPTDATNTPGKLDYVVTLGIPILGLVVGLGSVLFVRRWKRRIIEGVEDLEPEGAAKWHVTAYSIAAVAAVIALCMVYPIANADNSKDALFYLFFFAPALVVALLAGIAGKYFQDQYAS